MFLFFLHFSTLYKQYWCLRCELFWLEFVHRLSLLQSLYYLMKLFFSSSSPEPFDKQCFYVTVTGKRVGGYYKYVWIKHLTQLFPSRANPPKGKTFQSTVLRLCAVEFVAVALIFMYGNDKPVYSVTVFNQTTVCSCVSELSCKALTFMCLQLSSWSLNIVHPIVILKPWHCAYNSNVKALTLCLQ